VSRGDVPGAQPAAVLAGLLDALPDGLLALDDRWQVVYANPAGAALLQRPVAELVGRNLWSALPELAGTILREFLLHARGAGEPVTWTGFYPPAGQWLTVTAGAAEGLLQISLRAAAPRAGAGAAGTDTEGGVLGDSARLRPSWPWPTRSARSATRPGRIVIPACAETWTPT
jgi:PAS domain-containing protein